MIIDLTTKATEELTKIVESKNTEKPLRIFIAGYGWGGPSFGLALDERKEGDVETRVNDFTFVLEEGLEESFGKFTVCLLYTSIAETRGISFEELAKATNRNTRKLFKIV